MGGTLREKLRENTSDAHARLDAVWAGENLGARPAYGRFLRATAAALLPLEQLLAEAGVGELLPDWPQRRRAPVLADDLAGLGATPPATAPVDPIGSAAEMWGILYVLEGSRLGGKFLLQQVEASPDAAVRANCRYLGHGRGERLWPSFVQRLEAAAPADAAPLACARARITFGLFEAAARSEAGRA